MKRKEICEKTGLTQKALRLYEEKGLIAPRLENAGHNKTREYSQEDLRRLQTISMLRRALFTLAEIKEMLEDPRSIQVIYPQYMEWIRQQKEQLVQLYEVSAAIDIETVGSAQELTEKIKFAAANMPLPASDIHFNFKKLDEMEDQRYLPTPEERLNAALPSKEHRQAYVALSRTKQDDFLVRNDLLNDTKNMAWTEDGPVANNVEVPKTLGQRLLRGVLTVVVLLGGFYLLTGWQKMWRFGAWKWAFLGGFVLLLGLRIGLAVLDHRRNRGKWLSSIGWENQKSSSVNKKKIALIVTGSFLALALVVGGFVALAWYLTPVEPTGGPSTEGIDLKEFWEGMELEMFSGMIPNMTVGDMARGDFDLKDLDAITAGPDKIYFIWHWTLFSINSDYTDLMSLDRAYCPNDARSVVQEPEERACGLIYYDGCIYYISYDDGYSLMRHRTGEKIRPKELYSWFHAPGGIGLSDNGEIICYIRDHSKWEEEARIKVD